MKKTMIISICLNVILIGLLIGSYFLFRCKGTVTIGKPGPLSPTEYIGEGDPDTSCGDKINIDGLMQSPTVFRAIAWDTCKRNYRDFPLHIHAPVYHHIPMITYAPIYNIEAREIGHNITGMYFYIWGRVALGGGLTSTFAQSKLYDIGPKIGVAAFFE